MMTTDHPPTQTSRKKRSQTHADIPARMGRNQFAALVGLSAGRISALLDEDLPVIARKERSGSPVVIDVRSAIPWLVTRREKRPQSGKSKLMQLQAEKLQVHLAKQKGQLVDAQSVEQMMLAWTDVAVRTLEALPGRMGSELAAMTSAQAIRQKLMEEVDVMRAALSAHIEGWIREHPRED